ncbi:MAG: rubrerythrin family protein [Ignavibacteriales bacterium]|nr:rubrerythrin family protein [Ignavibacteriales bacterium]
MKAPARFLHLVCVITLALPMLLWQSGCQKKEESKQPEPTQGTQKLATIENLQRAYGGELKRSLWYDRFAKQAMKENLGDIAVLFRALGRSEKVHAEAAAKLLRSKGVEPIVPSIDSIAPGKAKQYLKLSLSNENLEQNLYASDTTVAQSEHFTEAAEWFRRALEADARHGRLLKKAIEQETNFARLPYMMCPECGYIVGSDKYEECPVCKTKKDKFQKI